MANVGGTLRRRGRPIGARPRVLLAGAACALAAIAVPAAVFACVSVASLTASPQSVQPGGKVTVTGGDYVPGFPVQIHLDSVTGPVLGTVASPAGPSSMRSTFKADVSIPSNISMGQHVLIATQDAHNMTSGIPARAAISVGTAPPSGQRSHRTASPVVDTGVGVGALVLIAVAAAAFGLVVLVVIAVLTSRRPPRPGTAGA